MQARSPDFIGIGAQKAGTTWLCANLRRHPRVWIPPAKELHYFDRTLEGVPFPPRSAVERANDASWRTGALADVQRHIGRGDSATAAWWACHHFVDHDDAWYRLLFAFDLESSLVGEITPRYSICGDDEISHMHAVAPGAKLLFLLREPVERFWSQCLMKYHNGSLEAGDAPAMRFFDTANGRPRGEYSKAIMRYCRRLDTAQVVLVFLDGIRREPTRVIQSIEEFLGLEAAAVDAEAAATPVNAAAERRPMPETLRSRVRSAYRREIEILAEVFGGHAAAWLEGNDAPAAAASVIRLSPNHVEELRRRHVRPLGTMARRPTRLFCISMQRSGTTSVGDWLEAHGLIRAGYPTSARLGWTRLWLEGGHEAIFRSPEFEQAEILEDDPWWCPDFYQIVATRFPEARFILLTRDADDWFESLCHHSGGRNPGSSDLHARIYGREADLRAALERGAGLDASQPGLLSLFGHDAHYKAVYRRHEDAARAFFSGMPGRLFTGRLDLPQTFIDLCDFAGVKHDPAVTIPRSNARTAEMAHQLGEHIRDVDRAERAER
ncbi:MAG: sulfotransferase [Planctomycetia bacterium]